MFAVKQFDGKHFRDFLIIFVQYAKNTKYKMQHIAEQSFCYPQIQNFLQII